MVKIESMSKMWYLMLLRILVMIDPNIYFKLLLIYLLELCWLDPRLHAVLIILYQHKIFCYFDRIHGKC